MTHQADSHPRQPATRLAVDVRVTAVERPDANVGVAQDTAQM